MQDWLIKKHHINIVGKGKEVLFFVHGFGCNQQMWRLVTPSFTEKYKIILIDLIGCGESDENAYTSSKYSTLQGYADDILEICKCLCLTDVILIGHSVSAMICTLAANKAPIFFKSIIMVAPSPRYINDEDYVGGFETQDVNDLIAVIENNYLGWATIFPNTLLNNADAPEIKNELANIFCRNNPKISLEFAKTTFFSDNREDVKKLSIPCLLLQSSQDIIAPITVGKYLHENIKYSTLLNLHTLGHCPQLTVPNLTIDAIKSFLYN